MKVIAVGLSFAAVISLIGVSASAAVNCLIIETKKGGTALPMNRTNDGGTINFEYTSNEIEASVRANATLTGAYLYIASLTAKPKQGVSIFAGKDETGIINVNAELNGQSVIVQCR